MYLKLDKAREDSVTVSYWVETTIKDEEASEHILKDVRGLCLFNKKSEELVFDKHNTDSFYFKRNIEFSQIWYRLKQFNKAQQGFPDLFDIATGG